MDVSSAYGGHFALRVLVLPVHPIRKSEYHKHLELLRKQTRIALADVPPTSATHVGPVNGSSSSSSSNLTKAASDAVPSTTIHSSLAPTPTSRGHLNLEFVEDWQSNYGGLGWLEDFQINRRTMAVVGIMDCGEWEDDLSEGAASFNRSVFENGPPSGVFAKRCYAFNPSETQKDNAEGLVVIPTVGDLSFYINTLLAELASGILAGLSNVMLSIDAKQQIPTPRERPTSLITQGLQQERARTSGERQLPTTPEAISRSRSPGNSILPDSALGRSSPAPSNPPQQYRNSSLGPPGVQPETVDAKTRKRLPARAAKLRGDLFCVAGRISEALAAYDEAIAIARSTGDSVWQAAATEGSILVQVYQAWQHGVNGVPVNPSRTNLTNLTQPAENSLLQNTSLARDLPPLFTQVITAYAKALPQTNSNFSALGSNHSGTSTPAIADTDETLPPIIYIETCLRWTRMHLALLLRNNIWDLKAVSFLIGFQQPPFPSLSQNDLLRAAVSSSIGRLAVVRTLNAAYGQIASTNISTQYRLQLLTSVAAIFGKLHMDRKRATVVREIAALSANALSTRDLREQLPVGDTHEADLASQGHLVRPTMIKSSFSSNGSEVVIELIEQACGVYGLQVVPSAEMATRSPSKGDIQTLMPSEASMLLLSDSSAKFGWPDLKVAVVKDAIRMAEAMPDYEGAVRFTITALRELIDDMSPSDQYRLSRSMSPLFAALSQRGARFEMAYWGPQNLVMSLEVAPLPSSHIPHDHPVADAEGDKTAAASSITHRDPFIYNPNRPKSKSDAKPVLIQGELAEFYATLQNPFLFELVIESIEISTSGCSCRVKNFTSSIPPSSFRTIRISCIPTEPGPLVVRGCKVRIAGCSPREFLVPFTSTQEATGKPKQLPQDLKKDRIKSGGMAHNASGTKQRESIAADAIRFMECTVVPAQPLLRLKESSLVQSAAMIYEGESSPVTFTFENVSALPIDFIRVAFSDSYTAAMQAYLSENEVPELEAYTIEQDALDNPVLTHHGEPSSAVDIKPDAEHAMMVVCHGKKGLSSGSVRIDYSYLHRPDSSNHSVFHTRQLNVPISMAVHPSVQCHGMRILRLAKSRPYKDNRHKRNLSITSVGQALAVDRVLEDALSDVDDAKTCLLVLEMKNVSTRQTFEVTLENKDDGRIKQTIEPSATAKFALSDEDIRRPIPLRTTKQFIVGKQQTSASELELFWYREELLKGLKARWREVGSRRSGTIQLQGLRLDREMLRVLRTEEIEVESAFSKQKQAGGDNAVLRAPENAQGEWCIEPAEFMSLTVSIRNRSARRLKANVSLQVRPPSHSSYRLNVSPTEAFPHQAGIAREQDLLSRCVLIDGTPTVSLPYLDPGDDDDDEGSSNIADHEHAASTPSSPSSTSVDFPICFMSKGRFTLDCLVREEEGEPQGHESVGASAGGSSSMTPGPPRLLSITKTINVIVT